MIPNPFEYAAPANLAEALGLLADGTAKPLAGGMSLIPMMKLRLASPEKLIDIGRLSELSYIREGKGEIRVGAGSTHHELESAPLLRAKCPLLAETASLIGDIQVRNVGTIGGSIAHADPAADYPAALQALEARIVLKSAAGERALAVGDFFLDTFTTALEPGEIVAEIIVPVDDASTGSSYYKFKHPASGFAIVGVAARIRREAGKVIVARIGVTGLAGHSFRAVKTEGALESGSTVSDAAALIADGAEANSDVHASAGYRRHMTTVYGSRAITAALSRTA